MGGATFNNRDFEDFKRMLEGGSDDFATCGGELPPPTQTGYKPKTKTAPPPTKEQYSNAREGNIWGLSDEAVENVSKYAKKQMEILIEALRKRCSNEGEQCPTDEKIKEMAAQQLIKDLEAKVNKVKENDPDKDPGNGSLIEFLKRRDQAIQNKTQERDIDDDKHFQTARQIRMMKQERLKLEMANGNLYTMARIANRQNITANKVLQNRRLNHIPARGESFVSPMNSISFNMSVGNP